MIQAINKNTNIPVTTKIFAHDDEAFDFLEGYHREILDRSARGKKMLLDWGMKIPRRYLKENYILQFPIGVWLEPNEDSGMDENYENVYVLTKSGQPVACSWDAETQLFIFNHNGKKITMGAIDLYFILPTAPDA